MGSVSEWLKEADCKSVALRYVGSNPTRPNHIIILCKLYKATILFKIIPNIPMKLIIPKIKRKRNLGILNKFLKGAKITKTNPATLLIKNRG